MSLLQFMLTGSPGYSKAVPQKKAMSVFPPLPPELSISWEEQDSLVFQDVSVRDLCERKWISFMCSVNICIKGNLYHHRGGGQWCVLMLPLRQSPMTNSPQTEEVTDAVKLSGWLWELVNPTCHQCWQGPCHTDSVCTPAGTKKDKLFNKHFIGIASCNPIIALESYGGTKLEKLK